MRGYQKGSSDAFAGSLGSTIDGPYVDGVSITRGSPRQLIWTYAIDRLAVSDENILISSYEIYVL